MRCNCKFAAAAAGTSDEDCKVKLEIDDLFPSVPSWDDTSSSIASSTAPPAFLTVAGAVAAKVFYTKVFSAFAGSINCGSSVDAVNGMADYFNDFGKSVVTTVRLKKTFLLFR